MGNTNSNFEFTSWDLEMIEISWLFVKEKQNL